MKCTRSLFALLAVPALFAGRALPLVTGAPAAEARPTLGGALTEERGQDEEETELAKHMLIVEDGVKSLRRSIRDEAKVLESLATLATVQASALVCKQEIPVMAAGIPEGERDAFVKGYRKEMIAFLTRLLELESALLEGDADAIKDAYRAVHDTEDSGHERFTEDG